MAFNDSHDSSCPNHICFGVCSRTRKTKFSRPENPLTTIEWNPKQNGIKSIRNREKQ